MADFAEEIKNLVKGGNDEENTEQSARGHHNNSESLQKVAESPVEHCDSLPKDGMSNGIAQQHGGGHVNGKMQSPVTSASENEAEIIDVESHQEETGNDTTGSDAITHTEHAQNTRAKEHDQNSDKEANRNDLSPEIVANHLGHNGQVRVLNIMPISEDSTEERNVQEAINPMTCS